MGNISDFQCVRALDFDPYVAGAYIVLGFFVGCGVCVQGFLSICRSCAKNGNGRARSRSGPEPTGGKDPPVFPNFYSKIYDLLLCLFRRSCCCWCGMMANEPPIL